MSRIFLEYLCDDELSACFNLTSTNLTRRVPTISGAQEEMKAHMKKCGVELIKYTLAEG